MAVVVLELAAEAPGVPVHHVALGDEVRAPDARSEDPRILDRCSARSSATVSSLSDPAGSQSDDLDGGSVRISVADTGLGMDDTTRTRIFEPYYSTKDRELGTGLGRATVFGTVIQSGGRIETAMGVGSTVHIDLPRITDVDRRIAPVALRSLPEFATDRGDEVVLLVEDEDSVRLLARRLLEAAGYTALEASNSVAALQQSRRFDSDIHVLLSDVVMPGMHGRHLASAIRRDRSGIAVVFMSGYANGPDDQASGADADSLFIAKPFSGEQLRSIVGQAAARARVVSGSAVPPSTLAIAPWP